MLYYSEYLELEDISSITFRTKSPNGQNISFATKT